MIARLARQALAAFTSWRARRRTARDAVALARRAAVVTPEIVARRAEIERLRRTHRPVQHLIDAQREAMTARLVSELSDTLPDRRFS
jgi:hypothetical protein